MSEDKIKRFEEFMEQFPSLTKGKNWLLHRETDDWVITEDAVKKYCLDKKKVKEAIMRLPDNDRRYILLNGLGLEGDR